MKPVLAALVLALAASSVSAPAAADVPQRHRNCVPGKAYAFGASNRVRVFETPARSEYRTGYACDLVTGRRRRLWATQFAQSFSASMVRFAGTAVAFHERECIKERCFGAVRSVELVSGRQVRAHTPDSDVSDIVVAPTGSTAYIARQGLPVSVVKAAGDGVQTLDRSEHVEPWSLALAADSRIYWTNAGAPRSARLDPEPQAFPPPRAIGGNRRCYPRGSETLAASAWARVYTLVGAEAERIVACNLRSGRRVLVDEVYARQTHDVDRAAFAEPFVAVAIRGCLGGSCGGRRVQTVDLARGTVRTVDGGEGGDWRVTDLELRPSGAVAWIGTLAAEGLAEYTELNACSPSDCARLDGGAGLERGSLAQATLERLYWTGAGVPRSAPFR